MKRPAFTLVELTVATSIACVIAAGIFLFFAGSKRLSREAYLEVSAAMDGRLARERALFEPTRTVSQELLPFSNRVWEVSQ